MDKTFKIGNREFILDQDKAEAAFTAKRVINGRKSMTFNLLPLKYQKVSSGRVRRSSSAIRVNASVQVIGR